MFKTIYQQVPPKALIHIFVSNHKVLCMFEEEEFNDLDFDSQLKRFEDILKDGRSVYFDVEVFEEIIDHFIGHNEYKKALRGLEMALTQHPGNANLLLLKADLYLSTGKLSKSLECLTLVEQIEPYNSEVFVLKANVYSQQRKFEEAIYFLKQAIKFAEEEDKVELYIDLAVEYENAEKYLKAISCLRHALELSPENETAMYEISYCFEISGKNTEAIEFYRAFIDEQPYSYLAWHNLGTALIKDGKLIEAVDAFDYCLAIKDDFSTAHFNKATVLMMDEKFHEAINHFTETIIRDEALPLTFLYLGECYEKTNELVLAEQNYLRAIELDEEFAESYVAMALLKMTTGHHIESDFYITKAISLDPQNPDFWYINAEVCENAGQVEKANLAYQKAISLDEKNVEILVDYSNFIQNLEGLDSAIELMLEKEFEFNTNELFNYRLSAMYYMYGKLQLAYKYFERGLEINSNNYNSAFEFYPQMENDQHILYLINSNFNA